MNQEDIIKLAQKWGDWNGQTVEFNDVGLERFFRLAYDCGAAAQREKVAAWMRNCGYATGHGDTIEDLLDHLGTQIAEGLKAEVMMEREACAAFVENMDVQHPKYIAAAIRARSKT